MVRGYTLSPSNTDRNYCIGTIADRDVILLQRTDTVSFPSQPSKPYTWLIMQIDLKHKLPMHIVLNAQKYDEHIHRPIFNKLSHLHKLDIAELPYYESDFTSKYAVYAPLQHSHTILQVLDAGTASILGQSYASLDFELFEDELLVYYLAKSISKRDIDHTIKAGIWFANQIDYPARAKNY